MPNRANIQVVKDRIKLLVKFGGICWAKGCEIKEGLEFAHKINGNNVGMSRGRKERVYAIMKNPKEYLLLCKEHHYQNDSYELELDYGKIPEWWKT